MITHVGVAFVHTNRLPEMRRWYHQVLGLPLGYRDEAWQEFDLAKATQVPTRFALDAPSPHPSAPERQPVMVSLGVDDIQAEVQRLGALGVEFYPSWEEAILDVGPTLVASFRDPDGNWLQLSQRKSASR